jgi:hypothetical protein
MKFESDGIWIPIRIKRRLDPILDYDDGTHSSSTCRWKEGFE